MEAPSDPLASFPRRHWRALVALGPAILDGAPTPRGPWEVVAREIDAQAAAASWPVRWGLILALDVLRILPVLYVRRVALFEDLDAETRVAFVEAVERSRLTLLLVAFKTFVVIAFFELPGELERVGYIGARRRFLEGSLTSTASLNRTRQASP